MIMKKIYTVNFGMMLALLLVTGTLLAQPQMVARYALDETEGTVVTDVSGNGYDATVNCEDCWAEGTINGGLQFNGTEAVTLPAADMGLTSNIGSVSFWMNSDGNIDGINTMFWAGDNEIGGGFGAENEMHIHFEAPAADIWTGGECSFFVIADPNTFIHSDPQKGGNPATPPVDPVLVSDGEWHHIVATWGGGIVSMYIDAVLMWDTTLYNPTGYALDHIYLGQMADGGRTFYGRLDDVRIYDDVLIALDVQDLFAKDYTGIDDLRAGDSGMMIYPNPASRNATIRYSAEAGLDVSLKLYNMVGAQMGLLYQGVGTGSSHEVHVGTGAYPSGVYMVQLAAGDKVSYSKLIIKR